MPGAVGIWLASIIVEVTLTHFGGGDSKMPNAVFVINSNLEPMRIVHPAVARRMLKTQQASVYLRYPFTLIAKPGISTGEPSGSLGLQVTPQGQKTRIELVDGRAVIWQALLTHRSKQIKRTMEKRSRVRRSRRNRKTRYRAPRFDNRTRKPGWYPPSMMHRVETTLAWISKLSALCGVGSIHVRRTRLSFDRRREIKNPQGHNAARTAVCKKLGQILYGDGPGHRKSIPYVSPAPAQELVSKVSPAPVISKTHSTLLIKSVGRGMRRVCNMDKYGFPRSKARRFKRIKGFSAGDHVRMVIPHGKYEGSYVGVIAGIRATGRHAVKVHDEPNLITTNAENLALIQRADGYSYDME